MNPMEVDETDFTFGGSGDWGITVSHVANEDPLSPFSCATATISRTRMFCPVGGCVSEEEVRAFGEIRSLERFPGWRSL